MKKYRWEKNVSVLQRIMKSWQWALLSWIPFAGGFAGLHYITIDFWSNAQGLTSTCHWPNIFLLSFVSSRICWFVNSFITPILNHWWSLQSDWFSTVRFIHELHHFFVLNCIFFIALKMNMKYSRSSLNWHSHKQTSLLTAALFETLFNSHTNSVFFHSRKRTFP